MSLMSVIKRDGRLVEYDRGRIVSAIRKAMEASGDGSYEDAVQVCDYIERDVGISDGMDVEEIQDIVEKALMHLCFFDAAKSYCLYREARSRYREANSRLMTDIDHIVNLDAKENDRKRENANIDGNTPMGAMLQIGASCAKAYNSLYLLRPEQAKAHQDGDIHIHKQNCGLAS